MKIRRATPDDSQALAIVHIDSWRAAYRGFVPDAHLASLDYARRAEPFRQSLAANSEETYVAERNGGILGFLSLGHCRDADVDHDSTGEIWGIYLVPEYWREGIGARLCRWAEAQLSSRGYTVAVLWVFAENARARRFYEAMGFAPDRVSKTLKPGKETEAVRYRKQLEKAKPEN